MSDLFLFRNTLRDLLRPRKLISALILIGLVVTIAALWRTQSRDSEFKADHIYNFLSSYFVFGYILIILTVVFSTSAVSQEIEQKTIPYLLIRPVPRWRILLVKYLAITLVATLTVWIADTLVALTVYGFSGLSDSRLGRDLCILPVGVFAYSAL